MNQCMCIPVPNAEICIKPNDIIKLGRFDLDMWKVQYGWYSWGENRPVCGWYLVSTQSDQKIKPLQLPDIDDIYIIESGCYK